MSTEPNRDPGWFPRFAIWRMRLRWHFLLVFVLSAPAVYYSGYRVCLQNPAFSAHVDPDTCQVRYAWEPHYRFQSYLPLGWYWRLQTIFDPAHQMDRMIRPKYWSVETSRFGE